MTQQEARISRQIMTALRVEGYFCFKVHGSEHMMSGLPDIIVCANGQFIGLETKRPETRTHTSKRQDYVHSIIRDAGGGAYVVTNVKEALEAIESHLKGSGAGG